MFCRLKSVNYVVYILTITAYSIVYLSSGPTEADDSSVSLRQWVKEHDSHLALEFKKRRKTVAEACHSNGLQRTKLEKQGQTAFFKNIGMLRINYEYLYYNAEHRFLYCKVPKSGSSTWVYNLLRLAGVPEEEIDSDVGLHKRLRDHYPKLTSRMNKQFRKSFKFLVVRHPFDRILSAYRDKLESYQRDLIYRDGFYHKIYGRKIVRMFRDRQAPEKFVNQTEPSFGEFVQYLLHTPLSEFDEHWKPISLLCSPCTIHYTGIAKMETFNQDTQYILNKLGLQDKLSVKWLHQTRTVDAATTAAKYYSQLSKSQVEELYLKYRLDFELFEYSPELHFNMTSS